MLRCALNAKTGDDVFCEDPSVLHLEERTADLFGMEAGLFVPTGTMSNLISVLSHCDSRASEIVIGANSHMCLWEGGGASNLGGIHTRQIVENPNDGTMRLDAIRDLIRRDGDVHHPTTELICLENTHNALGGVVLPSQYLANVRSIADDMDGVKVHIDGARIFNALVALTNDDVGVSSSAAIDMCTGGAHSVSVCLSKGLGAPLGGLLVGDIEFIRLARRARKRVGGGMRQAGVVASMGTYALEHHVDRLVDDHCRAKRIARALVDNGFIQPQGGNVSTNIVYFALPHRIPPSRTSSHVTTMMQGKEFCERLEREYGVKILWGFGEGGTLFRIVTHMDILDDDVDTAIEAILQLSGGEGGTED